MTTNPASPREPVPQGFSPKWAADFTNWLTRYFESLRGNVEFLGSIKHRGVIYTFTSVLVDYYKILPTDGFVLVNYAGAVTLILPPGTILDRGKSFIVQDDSGLAGANTITLQTQGTDKVNGASTTTVSTNYGRIEIVWTGSQYLV